MQFIPRRCGTAGCHRHLARAFCIRTAISSRGAARLRLPHALILPIGYVAEGLAHLFRTGEPPVTIDRARMARKRMFFTSTRAERELGYRFRPVEEALAEALPYLNAVALQR